MPPTIEILAPFRAALVRGFDDILMCDQHVHTADDPERPESFSNFSHGWRVVCERNGCDSTAILAHLHREHVLLLALHGDKASDPIVRRWLESFGWRPDRPCTYREAISPRPLEQGYLRCLYVVAANGQHMTPSINIPMTWSEAHAAESTAELLTHFVVEEHDRVGGRLKTHDEEQFVPSDPQHPANYFYAFSEGVIAIDFAGSIWSEGELCFWSRLVQYHK